MLQHTKTALVTAIAAAMIFGASAAPASAADQYIVQYRLTGWKTMHFEETSKAETHFATLKSLGCEAKAGEHGGHIDVTYRCPQWRSLAVKTDAGAHNWEKWLKACGFETAHEH